MTTEPRFPIHPLAIRVALVSEPVTPYPRPIRRAQDIFDLLRDDARTWDRERFLTVALDSSHRILGLEEVSVGVLNSAPIHPREVFKGLILANAAAFIGVHNHPSGEPTPSLEDIAVTRKLREAGQLLGISLLDHIVLGRESFTSLCEEGCGIPWRCDFQMSISHSLMMNTTVTYGGR
jgi:DNA repair protein RadC